jgi:NADH-quinone oxidoreductase subunit L
MLSCLWLVPALPLAGFVLLVVCGSRLSKAAAAIIGVGSVGVSSVIALLIAASFLLAPPPGRMFIQVLWTWIDVGPFTAQVAFHFDALALVMVLVVTFVAFWIHLYSAEFMEHDEGFRRFFAYMNLFVCSMLILVLADNLLLLYLGWEGVGLCSYLLIGFWYKDPANGAAARKAFIVTRVGDTALAIGLFLLFQQLGTLQIAELMRRAAGQWPVGAAPAVTAAALLLGGAVGKSAQLPLQTWLPDAMAGPTPVSALIHAATMVTAGVYLIARTHVLFALAPAVETAVAIVGAATLLLAAASALTQRDIKRVLAYSTMSQIGYMFLALGVGAWSAAIFHFMTHAFFKALLFLGAGVVIEAMHDEHDMFKMGGLRRKLPLTFWTFLIAAGSLSAIPIVTAGFYSKDLILWETWTSRRGSPWLWAAGTVGAFLTALYTFRMVFLTFFGEAKRPVERKPGFRMGLPLVVLAIFAFGAGFLELPEELGNVPTFTNFLHSVLPKSEVLPASLELQVGLQVAVAVIVLLGVFLAYVLYLRDRPLLERITDRAGAQSFERFWFVGWGFDWMYDALLVRPFVFLARADKDDIVDLVYRALAELTRISHELVRRTQTGHLRWYAMGITIGGVIILAIVVFQ